MRRQAFCWLIVLCLALLCGCSTQLRCMQIVEVNDTGYVAIDNKGTLYDWVDGEYVVSDVVNKSLSPIKPLSSYSNEYNLSYADLSTYSGVLDDAIGYTNYLIDCGYNIETILYNSTIYDVTLTSENDTVRVLYLGGDNVRIFFKDFSGTNVFPPYINKNKV